MNPRQRVLLGVLLLLGCLVGIHGRGLSMALADENPHDARSILDAAHELYAAGLHETDPEARIAQFRRARLQYSRLLDLGYTSADLLTNLGNAALQSGETGAAVVAYRQALALDPDHRRASTNLDHVRSSMPSWVPRQEAAGLLDTFFFWHRTLSVTERRIGSAVAFLLAMVLMAIHVYRGRNWARNLAVLPAAAWVALVVSTWGPGTGSLVEGVITAPGGEPALAADAPGSPRVFSEPLPEGAEVIVREQRSGWLRVELGGGSRSGWVREGSVEVL